MLRRCLAFALLVVGLVLPARLEAQQRLSAAERAQARTLFAAGSSAAEEGRWEDARAAFQQAFELTGAASALLNVGLALRELGRVREAVAAFEQLRGLESATADVRSRADDLARETRTRLATLVVEALPPGAAVTLDGAPVADDGTRPLRLPVDPGAHSLEAAVEGAPPFAWRGDAASGADTEVRVRIQRPTPVVVEAPPVTPAPSEAPTAEPATGGDITSEAWFWLVVTGAVVAGAGVATYLVLDDAAQVRPQSATVVRF